MQINNSTILIFLLSGQLSLLVSCGVDVRTPDIVTATNNIQDGLSKIGSGLSDFDALGVKGKDAELRSMRDQLSALQRHLQSVGDLGGSCLLNEHNRMRLTFVSVSGSMLVKAWLDNINATPFATLSLGDKYKLPNLDNISIAYDAIYKEGESAWSTWSHHPFDDLIWGAPRKNDAFLQPGEIDQITSTFTNEILKVSKDADAEWRKKITQLWIEAFKTTKIDLAQPLPEFYMIDRLMKGRDGAHTVLIQILPSTLAENDIWTLDMKLDIVNMENPEQPPEPIMSWHTSSREQNGPPLAQTPIITAFQFDVSFQIKNK